MKVKYYISLLLLLTLSVSLYAQLQVQSAGYSPNQLVSDVLIGQGVDVSNVQFTGVSSQRGYFDGTNSNIGIGTGVILSTGNIRVGIGPNDAENATLPYDSGCGVPEENPGPGQFQGYGGLCLPGDTDLDNILPTNVDTETHDAAVLEFDFIPESDTLRFNYVFASEEYPEYVCSIFNDIFAFLLSGPKPGGGSYTKENIALIPTTALPVAINTVNPGVPGSEAMGEDCSGGQGSLFFSNRYVNNTQNSVQFDGFTVKLQAVAPVTPCETYHIKIALADTGDGVWDSAVFLEENSFVTDAVEIDIVTVDADDNQTVGTTVAEGCDDRAVITFTVNEVVNSDFEVPFTIDGVASTAISGVDYQPISLPIIIPAGQSQVSIEIIPITDAIPEGVETIVFNVQTEVCEEEDFTITIGEQVLLQPPPLSCVGTTINSVTFEWETVPDATGYEVSINGGATWISPNPGPLTHTVTGLAEGTEVTLLVRAIGGSQFCDDNPNSILPCIAAPCVVAGEVLSKTDATCNGGSDGEATVGLSGATGQLSFQWDANAGNQTTATATGLSAGTYNVTIRDAFNCAATIAVQIGQPDPIQISDTTINPPSCNGTANGSITVVTSGGAGGYSYQWSNGGGTSATISGILAGTYTVTVTDSEGCEQPLDVTLPDMQGLALNSSFTQPLCNGNSNGTATVTATNGSGQLNYIWSNGQNTAMATGLSVGSYSVTVTDAEGCEGITTVDVTEPDALTVPDPAINQITCNGANDGSATVNPTGGTLDYTYLWNPGTQITQTASNLSPGMYNVTVTDDNNCTETAQINIIEPPSLVISDVATTDISCAGKSDGQIIITASGGMGTLQYSINNSTFQNSNTFNNLPIGEYDIIVQDENGCTIPSNASLIVPNALTITNIEGNKPDCTAMPNGTATVAVEGGTPSYSYEWSDGQMTATATGLPGGTYTVTITDAQGCEIEGTVDVSSPESTSLTLDMTSLLCKGDNTGTATAIAIGVGNLIYEWSDGQSTATAIDLAAGTYSVTITGEDECTTNAQIEVTEPDELIIQSITDTDITCKDVDNGTITVTPSGGTGAYNYQWSESGVFGENPTGLSPGTYIVTLTDANNCMAIDSVEITEPDELVIDEINGTDITCGGETNGMVSALASGGTAPLIYTWMPSGQTGTTVDNLPAGTYTVLVTDANDCTATDMVTISEPPPLEIDDSDSSPVICNGQNTGSASVTVIGGTGAYTYSWQPSLQTTPTANNLPQGTYTVRITDESGCFIEQSIDVDEPAALDASTSSTLTSCNGDDDGAATAEGTGGTPPYSYQWDANAFNQTTETAIGLSAGNYTVIITDANDCIFSTQVTVDEPDEIELDTDISHVNCINGDDGSATIIPTGGSGVYTFEWDAATGNQTGETATNLVAGNYTVNVFDTNNCFQPTTITIDQPATAITAFGVDSQISCAGSSDGFVNVIPSGGTGAFTFQWDATTGNQDTQTATNLSEGTYSVTVTDANACETTASASISSPPELMLTATTTSNGCTGSNDGSAEAIASGGTPNSLGNYTYEWSNGEAGPFAINLNEGIHTVTVTDFNGCTETDMVEITSFPGLTASISGENVDCFANQTGSISVNVEGGLEPYDYEWSPNANGATTPDLNDIPMGTYSVTVTDQNGCADTAETTIIQSEALSLNMSETDVDCYGAFTGTASVGVVGGSPPYSYQWSDSGNQSNATATNLGAAQYTVTITDSNGCMQSGSVEIDQPDEPFLFTFETQDVDCFGDTDGQVTLAGTGGTPFYEYSIDNGNTWIQSPVFVGLAAGAYNMTMRDLKGCIYEDSIEIYEPPQFAANAGEDVTIEIGDSTQLMASVDSVAGVYTYEWSTFDPDQPNCIDIDCQNVIVAPTTTSTYEVLVTNEFGCTDREEVIVYVDTERSVFVANAFTPNGDGANDFFYVQGDEKLARVIVFRIFDRWGEVVYEQLDTPANNPEFGWDGTMRGQEMNPSVFVWYAEVRFADGYSEVYKGDVSLIR